jgi:signal transduction histidine kinase
LLRSAAVSAGVPASVDVAASSSHPPEVLVTIYLCWLNMLASGSAETRSRITVTESENALAFELVGDGAGADLDYLRNRVAALGGELDVDAGFREGTRIRGSLPLAR